MSKRDVLSIAFKILGVIAIMYTIVLIPNIGFAISMFFLPDVGDNQTYFRIWHFAATLIYPIVTLICGFILLKYGDTITKKLIKDDKQLSIKVTEDWERRIFILALKIVGVVWLLKGIPEVIKSIGELIMRWYIYYYNTSQIIGIIIGGVVSLVLGFYLITNGRYFIKLAFGEQVATTLKKKSKGKLCKHCGKKLNIDDLVCSYCGTKFSDKDTMPL
ncbi:MAG: hypothetical protein WBB37_11960 [bacterium]